MRWKGVKGYVVTSNTDGVHVTRFVKASVVEKEFRKPARLKVGTLPKSYTREQYRGIL